MLSTSETTTPVWMFQYQMDLYDLLGDVSRGVVIEPWRAAQHRGRLHEGQRIYYLRGSGNRGTAYAAIVAVGAVHSDVRPYECSDCYPWILDVRYEALVDPPLTRDEMRADPNLGNYREHGYLPYTVGLQGTQFLLPPEIAVRTKDLVNERLKPLPSSGAVSAILPTELQTQSSKWGRDYQHANEEFSPVLPDLIRVSPEKVARANHSHAKLQNMLERYVRSVGLTPRSYGEKEPCFDIAWMRGETVFVAEVKSLTKDNEEMQLRLGLAQILMYRHRLAEAHKNVDVRAVLFIERAPTYPVWQDLCAELGIILAWPSTIVRTVH